MSANRRRSGDEPGNDCPEELGFTEFIERSTIMPIFRVQGKVERATKLSGRLVRFNRSVMILPNTARLNQAGDPVVRAERVKWNWRKAKFERTGVFVTLTWRLLDWVTRTATGDPNGTWMKVTSR